MLFKNGPGRYFRRTHTQRGASLTLVLIVLLLSGVIITPLLSFMSTGLSAGQVYEKKTDESYAADAGVEDALWQIKYDRLDTLFTSPAYNAYDYNTDWSYDLSEAVNSLNVTATIRNIWIPRDITPPSAGAAETIIANGKLVVAGSVSGLTTYKINISYYPEAGEDLRAEKIGVWLPAGFSYVPGSSNLETSSAAPYYSVPTVESHAGGQAVIWTFSSLSFASLPDANASDSPITAEITFHFAAVQVGRGLQALAWIKTSGVGDIPYSWDADQKVYKMTSAAGATIVDAYTVKTELRQLASAISGDYRAVGNSLMRDNDHDNSREIMLAESSATVSGIPASAEVDAAYLYWSAWRKDSSMQTVFLSSGTPDPCSNLDNWQIVTGGSGSVWSVYNSQRFRGHYSTNKNRYLTLKNVINLSGTPSSTAAAVIWEQWRTGSLYSGDALQFQFSGDGGSTWSELFTAFKFGDTVPTSAPGSPNFIFIIPRQYLTTTFSVRFYLGGFSGSGEYANLDDIAIVKMAADNSVKFKIDGDQVYFDGSGVPQKGTTEITADKSQILPNFNGVSVHGFSYSSFKDVTELVKAFSQKAPDPALNRPGNGDYLVGNVAGDPTPDDEWAYAAWSLIIVYSSPETKGHQLFLYDKFLYAGHNSDIDFDDDGQPGGTISGFIVPEEVPGEVNSAKLTAFVGEGDECYAGDSIKLNDNYLSNGVSPWNNVWNSKSPGVSNDGIDVETFDITWNSGWLHTGDTTATLNMPTQTDVWNVVYIIISFRSETTTGGTLTYLIRD